MEWRGRCVLDTPLARGMTAVCEERLVRRSSTSEGGSDEAIHSFFARLWIASRSQSSGAQSRDPVARNDDLEQRATRSAVIARLDRATQCSRGVSDRTEKPRRTGYPACAGYDGLCEAIRAATQSSFRGASKMRTRNLENPRCAIAHRGSRVARPGMTRAEIHPCTTDFAIMQWMPLEPLTVWVTRRSAARLQSV
jgi:hypothetical protein